MPAPRFRLREVLEEAGVSQTDFAREAGLAFATINRLCTNATAQVSLETLDNIMSALERRAFKVKHRGEEPHDIRLDDLIERDPAKRKGKGWGSARGPLPTRTGDREAIATRRYLAALVRDARQVLTGLQT